MNENFEDEDIILENSPLNQYLTTLNLGDFKADGIKPKPITRSGFQFSLLKSMIFKNMVIFQSHFKRKILDYPIFSILNSANSLNILNESDEIYLRYLIDTRFVQWSSLVVNESTPFVFKAFLTLVLIFIMIYFAFGKFITILSILVLISIYLILLLVYGFFIKYLVSFFFRRLVIISVQSRQTILLIQELLSLNQGYSRLVHLKDNSYYDCTKSFNEEFLEEFSRQFFSTLTHLSSFLDRYNNDLLKLTKQNLSFIKEVPWFQDDESNSDFDYLIGDELNCKQPIGQLKNLHNLIQTQFSECLKMLLLWTYSFDNHPAFFIPLSVVCTLHEFTNILQQLDKYRKILQIKTKSNCTRNVKREFMDNVSPPLIGSIRTLDLHLFEISEFLTQLSQNILTTNATQQLSDVEWLIGQRQLIERSKKHFDALGTCWQGLCDEIDLLLLNQNHKQNVEFEPENRKDGFPCQPSTEFKEPIVIDNYPEIVDEVIEGIPDEMDYEMGNDYRNRSVDPFEEKYTMNAKAILNELKSVIEVRAKDWKKREKLALKRRAAEGKFVFDRAQQTRGMNEYDFFDELDMERNREETVLDPCCNFENNDFNFDFRRSLGEMVLKQRQNMIAGANFIADDEEYFCE